MAAWPGYAEFNEAVLEARNMSAPRIDKVAKLALKQVKFYKFIVADI